MFKMVTMMLIEPMMEDAPNKWSAKIPMSKPGPICEVNGAYKVQPPAGAPPGAKNEPNNVFLENAGMISLTIPNAGRIMMYTSG